MKLFTEVEPFYEHLLAELRKAKHIISMMYLTFDHGYYSSEILDIIKNKIEKGVKVRIMIDKYGLIFDNFKNIFTNFKFIKTLSKSGVEFTFFKKASKPVLDYNPIHIKICAIDDETVLMGGSNIGDYYLTWQDTNLLIKGKFGKNFHEIYDYVRDINHDRKNNKYESGLKVGDMELLLTIPHKHYDIYNKQLEIIKSAKKEVHIWTWYFLPNKEVYDLIVSKVGEGVKVKILLSNRTRIFLVDMLNRKLIRKLKEKGVELFRYNRRYTHSKVYWNESNNILLGSSNFSRFEFNHNYESSIFFNDVQIAQELAERFEFFSEESI